MHKDKSTNTRFCLCVSVCLCLCVCVHSEPVFFGIFKVLLVVSRFQKVTLNDTDDPASCPLT